MTQSSGRKAPDPYEFMQQAYSLLPQIGDDARQNLQIFWKNQDKLLDSMSEFSRSWFERRRDATRTALDAANCMCDAQNPADAIQHCQTWLMGSAERIAADAAAWQKHIMNAIELMTPPLSPQGEGRKVEIQPSPSVSRAGKTQAAA